MPNDNNDANGEPEREGFAIPIQALLGGLGEAAAEARAAHDRIHMEAESAFQRISNFLDGLNVEQLMALRHILTVRKGMAFVSNRHLDGQVVALLRAVHHVDPDTGLRPDEALGKAVVEEKQSPPESAE
jgi:hypothetical protein